MRTPKISGVCVPADPRPNNTGSYEILYFHNLENPWNARGMLGDTAIPAADRTAYGIT